MRTIGDFSRMNAERCPNKTAVLFEDQRLSYEALDRLSNQVARGLTAHGVAEGDRVALMAFNCPDFVVLSQATAKIGAILVPVNIRHATGEIGQLIQHCSPKILFVQEEFLDAAKAACAETDALSVIRLSPSPDMAAFVDGRSDAVLDQSVSPDAAAAIIYTSGTTGAPKGIVISHEKYLRIFQAVAIELEVRERDVFQAVMPLFHNGGFASVLNPALMVGAGVSCYGGHFDPDRVLNDVVRHGVTITHWVPTMLARVLPLVESGQYDFSKLRKIHYGAMPMPPDILARTRRLFDVEFFQGYGTTDAGLIACLTSEQHDLRPGMTGRPVFNTRSRIVDEQGRPVAIGAIGEVVVDAATSGMIGYWRDEALTRDVIRDGWIHTGDMARRETDGFFTLVERKNFMIISGGENIYPSEVENVLSCHPAVREVAVFGIPNAVYGEAVCAALVLSGDRDLSIEDVHDFCNGHLARYKMPRHLMIEDELPRTATGKLAIGQLRAAAKKKLAEGLL